MVEKAWVHLSRVDPAYEIGASKFVREVAAASGGNDLIICPCIDCRNIDRHSGSVLVDHLVTRGMDEAYKMRSDWYLHGELSSGVADDSRGSHWNDEIYGLYRAAECFDEALAGAGDLSEMAEGDDKKEDGLAWHVRNFSGAKMNPCFLHHFHHMPIHHMPIHLLSCLLSWVF